MLESFSKTHFTAASMTDIVPDQIRAFYKIQTDKGHTL